VVRSVAETIRFTCPIVLMALIGCLSHDHMKPLPPQEEYKVPPLEDKRFSQPVQYPKNLLNTEPIKKSGLTKDGKNPASFKQGGAGPGGPGGN